MNIITKIISAYIIRNEDCNISPDDLTEELNHIWDQRHKEEPRDAPIPFEGLLKHDFPAVYALLFSDLNQVENLSDDQILEAIGLGLYLELVRREKINKTV